MWSRHVGNVSYHHNVGDESEVQILFMWMSGLDFLKHLQVQIDVKDEKTKLKGIFENHVLTLFFIQVKNENKRL